MQSPRVKRSFLTPKRAAPTDKFIMNIAIFEGKAGYGISLDCLKSKPHLNDADNAYLVQTKGR